MNRCLGYHDPTEDFKGDETFGFAVSVAAVVEVKGSIGAQVQGQGKFREHRGHSDIELQSVVGFSDGVHDEADFDNDCLPVLTSMYCYQRGDDGTGETSFLCARTAVGKLSAEELSSLSKLACLTPLLHRFRRCSGEDASSAEQAANAALAELELEVEDERVEMEAEIASLTRRAAALGHEPERR